MCEPASAAPELASPSRHNDPGQAPQAPYLSSSCPGVAFRPRFTRAANAAFCHRAERKEEHPADRSPDDLQPIRCPYRAPSSCLRCVLGATAPPSPVEQLVCRPFGRDEACIIYPCSFGATGTTPYPTRRPIDGRSRPNTVDVTAAPGQVLQAVMPPRTGGAESAGSVPWVHER